MRHLRNIFNLGIKELRSLLGDKAMLTLIVFSFTVSVYSSATVTPGSLNLAPIAIADMDQSQLSNRIVNSFYRPWFLPPEMITADEMDAGLDAGRYTFAINIPPNFQRDVLAGRQPDIQVNVDATRMSRFHRSFATVGNRNRNVLCIRKNFPKSFFYRLRNLAGR